MFGFDHRWIIEVLMDDDLVAICRRQSRRDNCVLNRSLRRYAWQVLGMSGFWNIEKYNGSILENWNILIQLFVQGNCHRFSLLYTPTGFIGGEVGDRKNIDIASNVVGFNRDRNTSSWCRRNWDRLWLGIERRMSSRERVGIMSTDVTNVDIVYAIWWRGKESRSQRSNSRWVRFWWHHCNSVPQCPYRTKACKKHSSRAHAMHNFEKYRKTNKYDKTYLLFDFLRAHNSPTSQQPIHRISRSFGSVIIVTIIITTRWTAS